MQTTLRIGGMSCAHCEKRVSKALADAGAQDILVSAQKGEATFTHQLPDDKAFIQAVEEAGYKIKKPGLFRR